MEKTGTCFRLNKALLLNSKFLKIKWSKCTKIFTLLIKYIKFTIVIVRYVYKIYIFGKWDNLVYLPYSNLTYCTQHLEIQYL